MKASTRYVMTVFQPSDGFYCSDVYISNAPMKREERRHCGRAHETFEEAINDGTDWIIKHATGMDLPPDKAALELITKLFDKHRLALEDCDCDCPAIVGDLINGIVESRSLLNVLNKRSHK